MGPAAHHVRKRFRPAAHDLAAIDLGRNPAEARQPAIGNHHQRFAEARDRLLEMANREPGLTSVRLSDPPDSAALNFCAISS